jgi:hypothetical protein
MKGGSLGLVMVNFMTAYRSVLMAIHDDAVVDVEKILGITKLVRRKPKPTPTPDERAPGVDAFAS